MRAQAAGVYLARAFRGDKLPPCIDPEGSKQMALVKLSNYKDAAPEAQAVFDDIMATRDTDYVNNIWRALAAHPPLLKRFWGQMKEIMVKPSRLDPLTKELIYLAVSITNDCTYCINTHTAAARKKGLDDEVLGELNEIVALANAGNRLTSGLQVEVDDVFAKKHKYSEWKAPKRSKNTRERAKKTEKRAKKAAKERAEKAKVAGKSSTRKSRTAKGDAKAVVRRNAKS
jgi:AhpD family alkylhydroperoxidase